MILLQVLNRSYKYHEMIWKNIIKGTISRDFNELPVVGASRTSRWIFAAVFDENNHTKLKLKFYVYLNKCILTFSSNKDFAFYVMQR